MKSLIEDTIQELDLDDKQGEKHITYIKKGLLTPENIKIPVQGVGLMTLQEASLAIRRLDYHSPASEQAILTWIEQMPINFLGIREEVDRVIRLMFPNKLKVVNLVRGLKEEMKLLEKRNEKLESENEKLKQSIYEFSENLKQPEQPYMEQIAVEKKKPKVYV